MTRGCTADMTLVKRCLYEWCMIGWPVAIRSTTNGSESKGEERNTESGSATIEVNVVLLDREVDVVLLGETRVMWCCSR